MPKDMFAFRDERGLRFVEIRDREAGDKTQYAKIPPSPPALRRRHKLDEEVLKCLFNPDLNDRDTKLWAWPATPIPATVTGP